MLRLALAALLALALTVPVLLSFAAAEDPARPAFSEAPPPYSEVHFDHSLLPASTGWFAVPITTDREAWLRVEMDIYEHAQERFSMGQGILAVAGRETFPLLTFGGYAQPPVLEVAHDGKTVAACCEGMFMGWSGGDGGARAPILLRPGETLWVGLAAYDWTDWHFASFTIVGQALLTQGAPVTGERVEAVDLYAEALRAGTRVSAFHQAVQPTVGTASRAWEAEGYGLFSLHANRWSEEASARLTVALPGMEPVSRVLDDEGFYVAAHRGGSYAVTLDEVEGPLARQGEWMGATAFFADVDVPGDAVFIYP